VRKLVVLLGGAAVAALTVVALASARPSVIMVGAKLDAMQEVPHSMSTGKGAFTADITGNTLKWRLTFSHLTGAASAAHIHVGKKGKAGKVLVALCGPCKSGQKGTMKISPMVTRDIKRGLAYVNVHTKKYANGEIRGQLATH
jgi:hypothetical protein